MEQNQVFATEIFRLNNENRKIKCMGSHLLLFKSRIRLYLFLKIRFGHITIALNIPFHITPDEFFNLFGNTKTEEYLDLRMIRNEIRFLLHY